MKIKNVLIKGFMAAVMGAFLMVPAMSSVYAEEAAQPADKAVTTEANGDNVVQVNLPYKYTSTRFGYTIMCPTQPNVVPASLFDETSKGDILIFEGNVDDVKKAWIVLINAYDDGDIPANAGSVSDAERKTILDNFSNKYVLTNTRVVEVAENVFGIYGITPKELQVDTNGDGQLDETVTAENQMVQTYLPGEFGGRFMISLIDSPEISMAGLATYNAALTTFKQWPTSEYQQFLELSKLPKKKKN
ncbi:hypothetical protein [Anaerovibrio lipolyticus]|uniref:hypothetical protein n=1 Tax=Anaerovibrio lipolyticus TaxID=82374 RepID=UPI000485254B|nr:hypothetical protein [Anaerovibrio lipolyticus]